MAMWHEKSEIWYQSNHMCSAVSWRCPRLAMYLHEAWVAVNTDSCGDPGRRAYYATLSFPDISASSFSEESVLLGFPSLKLANATITISSDAMQIERHDGRYLGRLDVTLLVSSTASGVYLADIKMRSFDPNIAGCMSHELVSVIKYEHDTSSSSLRLLRERLVLSCYGHIFYGGYLT